MNHKVLSDFGKTELNMHEMTCILHVIIKCGQNYNHVLSVLRTHLPTLLDWMNYPTSKTEMAHGITFSHNKIVLHFDVPHRSILKLNKFV